MTNATSNDKQENILKRSANAVIDLLSSFFLPIINLLVSVGILKGALTLLQVSGVVAADTTTYAILNGMADALFYFIPIPCLHRIKAIRRRYGDRHADRLHHLVSEHHRDNGGK